MAEQSLKNKTVKGVAWSGIDNIITYVVSFVVGIILARLLTPDDYGLIGIIAIFTVIFETLIDGGFGNALIRKLDVKDEDYDTVFLTNMGMSIVLYFVLYFGAPFIATFFHRVELILLVRGYSMMLVLGALSLVQQTILIKRIDFKTQTKISLISSLISGVIGITMAYWGYGVWALVGQGLSQKFTRTLLLWIYNKWIPKLRFSVSSFKELFDYSWKLTVSWLLNNIWMELYQVIIGKFYEPSTLGQYTRAKQFSGLFSKNLTNVISRVTYPVLSELQNDKEHMVLSFRRLIKISTFISAVGMFLLGAISEPLLYCLIGPKWHDAAVFLPLICIVSSLYPINSLNMNMLQVQGRSDLFLYLEIAKKTVAIGPIFIGIFVGILPMLYASIITGVICFFINSYFTGKLYGYNSTRQLLDVAPSFGMAVIVAVPVYFFKYFPFTNWLILPMQVIFAAFMLLILCEKTKFYEYVELKKIVTPYINKICKRKKESI